MLLVLYRLIHRKLAMNKASPPRLLFLEKLEGRLVPAGISLQSSDNIVTGLYQQFFNHAPTDSQQATYSNQLQAGVPVASILDALWSSVDFRTQEVNNYYHVYLNRNPSSAEADTWVQSLLRGTPEATVQSGFLGSLEFSNRYITNNDYTTALYHIVLEREPDSLGLANHLSGLNAGVSRTDLAKHFLNSNEYHNTTLLHLYDAVLGRPADTGGLQSHLDYWNRSNASIRTIESAFLASPENIANLSNLSGIFLHPEIVTEYPLSYAYGAPSTHEIMEDEANPGIFFITGQLHDTVIRFDSHTGQSTNFLLPQGAGPHGMAFDSQGRLFVSMEFLGQIAQIDPDTGTILQTIDVHLTNIPGSPEPINTSPHDITVGADGLTVYFTGKATGTVGIISPDGSVNHYSLPTPDSLPIYLTLGNDGNVWGTELVGNKILRVTPTGQVTEFAIPTSNSRPIVITADPLGRPFLWFSEENGHAIGKISSITGLIEEFTVPKTQSNMLLAGMAFDQQGNLYAQSYVNQKSPIPPGPDDLIRLDSSILEAEGGDLSGVQVMRFPVPSTNTVFHRITCGTDGNLYFTELAQDKVGKLQIKPTPAGPATYFYNLGGA